MHGFSSDIRHALRQFGSAPAWSATVVGVLALGLGLALASFMLVDALLFRPLGVVEQERLVKIASTREHLNSVSYPAYLQYRDRADLLAGAAAFGGQRALHWLQPDGSRLRVKPATVSGNFFELLGLSPTLGRAIGVEDDRAGAPLVAVVSNAFWRDRLGARSDAIGASLMLDDRAATVVGVMPAAFVGLEPGDGPDLWLPMATGVPNREPLEQWNWHWLTVIGRLKPGVDVAQADAQVDSIAGTRDGKKVEGRYELRAQAVPLFPLARSAGQQGTARTAWMLLGGALMILLCACANATGLLLVRGERRRGELAVRASLGADALRLARLLFAESLLLTLAGAALGLLVARMLAGAALSYGAAESVLLVNADTLPSFGREVAVALALAVGVAALAGLLPALRPRRLAVVEELKAGGGSGGGRRWQLGRVLVGAQFALTVVLVIGAGLMLRSLWGLWQMPLGAAALEARVVPLDYSAAELGDNALSDRNNRLFLEALAGAPGVAAAGIGAMVPISGSSMETTVKVPERTDGSIEEVQAFFNPVSAGFFAALDLKPVAGRDFGPNDVKGAPRVAIVSQAFAKKRFPGVDPIGRHVDTSRDGTAIFEIVGVAPDIKLNEINEPWHEVLYVPIEQRTFGGWYEAVLRPEPGAEASVQAALARAWKAVSPNRALPQTSTIAERASDAIATPRFLAATLGVYALLALVLAATGIYGAFAFWISVRRRELGLRLALGSSQRGIFRLVLGDGLRVIAWGALVGVGAAAALARVVAAALVEVSPYDIATYVAVPLLVAAAGLLATALPARSAARTEPQQSLRSE